MLSGAIIFDGSARMVSSLTGRPIGAIVDYTSVTRRAKSPLGWGLESIQTATSNYGVTLEPLAEVPTWGANNSCSLVMSIKFVASDTFGTILRYHDSFGLLFNSGAVRYYDAASSTMTVTANEWFTLGLTRTVTTGNIKYYKNGVFVDEATGTGNTQAGITFDNLFNDGTSQSAAMAVAFLHCWNGRALTADEMMGQHLDPYALYVPTQKRIMRSVNTAKPWLYYAQQFVR